MNKQTIAHKELAKIIKQNRAVATANRDAAENEEQNRYWQGQNSILWTVAEQYAEATGVDKAKFLSDCGITA